MVVWPLLDRCGNANLPVDEGGIVAICISCGNSIGNTDRCGRCGGENLRALDHNVAGNFSREPRSDSTDWNAEAHGLGNPPSSASKREVRREGRQRRAARSRADASAKRSGKRDRRDDSVAGIWQRRPFPAWSGVLALVALMLGTHWVLERIDPPVVSAAVAFNGPATPIVSSGWDQVAAFLLLSVAAYVAIAAAVARSARRKGRSALAWFVLALFFPVISWIIVATMAPSVEAIALRGLRDGSSRRCPNCAEAIRTDARICRYCKGRVA